MESIKIEHKLSWYEKYGDEFIGECTLEDMSLTELQNLFEQQSDDPMIHCYPVLPSHLDYLQKFVKHRIDLKLFDYFVEG